MGLEEVCFHLVRKLGDATEHRGEQRRVGAVLDDARVRDEHLLQDAPLQQRAVPALARRRRQLTRHGVERPLALLGALTRRLGTRYGGGAVHLQVEPSGEDLRLHVERRAAQQRRHRLHRQERRVALRVRPKQADQRCARLRARPRRRAVGHGNESGDELLAVVEVVALLEQRAQAASARCAVRLERRAKPLAKQLDAARVCREQLPLVRAPLLHFPRDLHLELLLGELADPIPRDQITQHSRLTQQRQPLHRPRWAALAQCKLAQLVKPADVALRRVECVRSDGGDGGTHLLSGFHVLREALKHLLVQSVPRRRLLVLWRWWWRPFLHLDAPALPLAIALAHWQQLPLRTATTIETLPWPLPGGLAIVAAGHRNLYSLVATVLVY